MPGANEHYDEPTRSRIRVHSTAVDRLATHTNPFVIQSCEVVLWAQRHHSSLLPS